MIPDYMIGYVTNITRLLIALFILIIFLDARSRIRKTLDIEWDVNYLSKHIPRRGVATSLSKIVTRVQNRSKYQLANTVLVEICRGAAIFHNKPSNYFLGIRTDLPEIRKYFQNKELISFLYNSDIWVDRYLMHRSKGFSFRKNKAVTPEFMNAMEEILKLFKMEIIATKGKIEVTH